MANFIYGPGPHKPFDTTAGGTISNGDLLVRSSTTWVRATDGQQAEGLALSDATTGQKITVTTEEGLVISVTGTLAANAVAYVKDHQSVDDGSQGNKNCGISRGLDPNDSTRCLVALHFKDAETVTRA